MPGGGAPPSEPQRLHPASPVLDLIVSSRQWLFPVAVVVLASDARHIMGPVALFIIALVVGWKVLAWSRFSYVLRDGALVIDKGVLQRQHREVPVARIQQVDLRRKLRHRALGVAVVRIDTAGGGNEAEVVLEAIADDEANSLRTALLGAHRAGEASGPTPGEPSWSEGLDGPPPPPGAAHPGAPHAPSPVADELVRLSTKDLVIAGITGSRLAAALPVVAAGVGLLFELPQETSEDVLGAIPTSITAFVLTALIAVPVVLLAAVGSSILTDHGFTLVRTGSDLHVRRGLLDQREATLSLHRVQAIRVHQNLIRRRLGLASVQLQSAGSGHAAEGDVTRLTIPYAKADALVALLAELAPVAFDHPPLTPAPAAARRRAWVRNVVPPALVLVPLTWWLSATTSMWAVAALLLLAPFAANAELVFRNLGHAATPQLVVARRGGFNRETIYVPVAKTQSTTLASSPFQRRAGLATLHVEVAGSGAVPQIQDGDAATLAQLRRGALGASAARADEEDVRRRVRSEVA